jgi:hypothetical protein
MFRLYGRCGNCRRRLWFRGDAVDICEPCYWLAISVLLEWIREGKL